MSYNIDNFGKLKITEKRIMEMCLEKLENKLMMVTFDDLADKKLHEIINPIEITITEYKEKYDIKNIKRDMFRYTFIDMMQTINDNCQEVIITSSRYYKDVNKYELEFSNVFIREFYNKTYEGTSDEITREEIIEELEKLYEFMNTKKEIILSRYNELAEDDEKITMDQLDSMTKEQLKTPFSNEDDVISYLEKNYVTMKRREIRDNK